MGMFDSVKYEAPCPKCGTIIDEWQSKDSLCLLETIEPWRVKHFYSPCDNCKAWVVGTVDAEVEHVVKRCEIKLVVRENH